jgi:putative transposase
VKKKRFSEEQIIAVLKEAEAGAKVLDLCRRHGISDATFYNWKAKYAGMELTRFRGRFSAWVTSGYPQGARRAPRTLPSARPCG